MKAINLIAWQDKVGEELKSICAHAIGKHVKRSRHALFSRSVKYLEKLGWEPKSASQTVKDAFDMAELEMAAEKAKA